KAEASDKLRGAYQQAEPGGKRAEPATMGELPPASETLEGLGVRLPDMPSTMEWDEPALADTAYWFQRENLSGKQLQIVLDQYANFVTTHGRTDGPRPGDAEAWMGFLTSTDPDSPRLTQAQARTLIEGTARNMGLDPATIWRK